MSGDELTMDLVRRFGIPGALTFEACEGGLVRARVRTETARGTVYLHGAQVTAFEPAGGRPVLFLARGARLERGAAIRGGVPICLPWFGPSRDDPTAPSHGLARTREWQVLASGRVAGKGLAITFGLELGGLVARYTAVFGRVLDLTLELESTAAAPRPLEAVLHSYLSVGDVRAVEVLGLEGASYLDQLEGRARRVEGERAVRLTGETDRVYLGTGPRKTVVDPVLERRIVVESEGAPSTVLWNPWSDKTARLADLDEDEWPAMLCLETGRVAEEAVVLEPGGSFSMRTTLAVEPL